MLTNDVVKPWRPGKMSFTVERTGCHHLNQVIKLHIHITNGGTAWCEMPFSVIEQEVRSTTCKIFLPKMFNLTLVSLRSSLSVILSQVGFLDVDQRKWVEWQFAQFSQEWSMTNTILDAQDENYIKWVPQHNTAQFFHGSPIVKHQVKWGNDQTKLEWKGFYRTTHPVSSKENVMKKGGDC